MIIVRFYFCLGCSISAWDVLFWGAPAHLAHGAADGAQDGEVPRSSERRLDEALVMAEEPTKEQREFALLVQLGMASAHHCGAK